MTVAMSLSRAATRDSGIRGTIKDGLGAAVGNATVFVYTDRVTSTRTKENGTFSIDVASDGLFDVFVSALGFAPTCSKIQIKKGQWVSFNRKLYVDPLTVKLYGDTFDSNGPHAHKQ